MTIRSLGPWVMSVGMLPIAGVAHADVHVNVEPGADRCELAAPLDPNAHPPATDCAFSEDTGYVQGNPFTISVFHIDGEPVEIDSGNAFWVMREAAAADGVDMHINSGFRTMSEQEYLYACYVNCNCNNCNLAATPGYSNHQSGHAFDLNTTGYSGAVYNWLAANGASFGFANTVAGEHWHWEWWEGGPGGGVCLVNSPPRGSFDAAACEGIAGWAQDPDQPDVVTDVHLYFDGPAGDAAATSISLPAGEHRPDLCDILAGHCDHGFSMPMPMSLRDAGDHSVFAYAIDLDAEENALLYEHPFNCLPPELDGGLRAVDPAAFEAWQFSEFLHLAPVDAATVDATPVWLPIEAQPRLVQVDGSPEVWLVDAGTRRHVPSPVVAARWGFDLGTVEIVDAGTLDTWAEWLPVRETPLLVTGSDGTMFLVDDAMLDDKDPDTDGGSSGSGGDDGASASGGATSSDGDSGDASGSGSDTDAETSLPGADGDGDGCACTSTPGRGPWIAAPLLVALGVIRRRRR